MNPEDKINDYIFKLGHFWQSFNNLELFLRLYLYKKAGKDNIAAMALLNNPVGSDCEENSITDWKSFGQLCDQFNAYQDKATIIDFSEIIELRDAMAHGRVSGDSNANMHVVKYSRPKSGRVRVEYNRLIKSSEMELIIGKIASISFEITKRMGAKILPEGFA